MFKKARGIKDIHGQRELERLRKLKEEGNGKDDSEEEDDKKKSKVEKEPII